ncbi:MAG: SusC/RagA family TonB-linked outer membrane protein [Clostridium sp.]|nr:SusC/RagA family TonB-linked outer membrane protein [Clostridium sp.]
MKHARYLLLMLMVALMATTTSAQTTTIRGVVYDEFDDPIMGAVIHEVDKNNRVYNTTTTDINGEFSIPVKNMSNKLRVSYVGYERQDFPIQPKMEIKMKSQTSLHEVVVTASKIVKDGSMPVPTREFSGAMQSISTKEFEGLSVSSIDDALQGRLAGLDIVSSSGDLGAGSSMRIRGAGSINANTTPLIVLNDIPYESHVDDSFDYSNATQEQFASLLSINPEDIEEITVLKDGASAAIYGARGANGVIMIRTKRGVKGPPRVQILYKFSGHKQPKGRKMLSGDDYTMLMKQALFNVRQDENDSNIPEYSYDRSDMSRYYNFSQNTDWVDEVRKYGFTNDQTVNITGGGDKAKYRVSIGYYDQTGTIIGQHYNRISNLMNLDYQVSDRLKFSTEFQLTYSKNKKNYQDGDFLGGMSLLDIAYKKMPNVSVYEYDASGQRSDNFYFIPMTSAIDNNQKYMANPVALAELAKYDETSMRIIPTLRLQYDILDPSRHRLRYTGYVQFDIENKKENKMLPREFLQSGWQSYDLSRVYNRDAESLNIQTKHDLLFVPNLGDKHSLMLYAAWELTTGNSQYQSFKKSAIPTGIDDATQPGYFLQEMSERGQWRSMAYMGRLHYSLLGRYIIDATVRRDGSTRFGPGHRWGTFPAVSLKWIISDEPFMEPTNNWLNMLAIRPGFGKTGRMPDSEYLHFAKYTTGGTYIDIPSMRPESVRLNNLRWETATSFNVGADFAFWNYKVNADANIYWETDDNLLFQNQSIPSSSGFGSLSWINGGSMKKQGWEINIYTTKLISFGDWSFDVNANFANSTGKIKSLLPSILNDYNADYGYNNGEYLSRIQVGNAYGSIYGFRYKGVYQYSEYQEGRQGSSPVVRDASGKIVHDSYGNPLYTYFNYGGSHQYKFQGGDAIYEDINHDGNIDELDIVYLGNCNPKLTGGFGFTVRWKQLSMNAFFNYRYGNKIINRARMNAEAMENSYNQSIAVNYRWRKEGDLTEIPRAHYNGNVMAYNTLGSDRFVEDGSFLRFKYLTFNYAFDKDLLQHIRLNSLNLYLTLNNLWTWTKYTGVDPELSPDSRGICYDDSNTPRSQYFTFGVTVGF